ncbi:MAG: hypothetical protein ACJAT6_000504 [Akkermansiaceae bacterium]|jgi:hypothetical protein
MAVLFKSTWETKEPEEQDATMSAVAEIKNSGIFMVFKVGDERILLPHLFRVSKKKLAEMAAP